MCLGFVLYGTAVIVIVIWGRFERVTNPRNDPAVAQSFLLWLCTIYAFVLLPVLVSIPLLLRRWRASFDHLGTSHPDLVDAVSRLASARRKWLVLIIIWVHLNLLPALLQFALVIGAARRGG